MPSFMWKTVGAIPSPAAPARRRSRAGSPGGSCADVAAVELVGQGSMLGSVLRDVGIEEEQRYAPTCARQIWATTSEPAISTAILRGFPSCVSRWSAMRSKSYAGCISCCQPSRFRYCRKYRAGRATRPDEWKTQIARALQVVSRQNAETTRVDRNGLVQPELGAEVGYLQSRSHPWTVSNQLLRPR